MPKLKTRDGFALLGRGGVLVICSVCGAKTNSSFSPDNGRTMYCNRCNIERINGLFKECQNQGLAHAECVKRGEFGEVVKEGYFCERESCGANCSVRLEKWQEKIDKGEFGLRNCKTRSSTDFEWETTDRLTGGA